MAQQYIKIFDDTVLKQSINQGYEVQRTNSRLGNFTMGELAFTRDTARLFVGNSTNINEDQDSKEVIGGSLAGNKYLGLIDSKPLTHFYLIDKETGEKVDSSVHFPLSYENDTSSTLKDSQGFNVIYTEKALLCSDSKFRTDKNKGWDKKATYNRKYDAYNGDFVFDTFNNALILFDKNIVPVKSDDDPNWTVTNSIQQYKKSDGTLYTETDGDYSKYRTRLINVTPPADESNTTVLGNPNYPIYGDGFVVMRIIEPDGITLGYREKKFTQSSGKAENDNYSHNYIELKKVPPSIILESLDDNQFEMKSNDKIGLTGDLEIKNIILENPVKITGGPSLNFKFDSSSNKTGFIGVTKVANNQSETTVVNPTITIKLDGKSVSQTITPTSGEIEFDLSSEGSDDGSPSPSSNDGYLISDPFNINDMNTGSCIYSGSSLYDRSGNLISFEKIPDMIKENVTLEQHYSPFVLYDSSGSGSTYKPENSTNEDGETETNFIGNFAHEYLNAGLNYLKNPEPIAWGTGKNVAYGKFFINPYVISPKKFNSNSLSTPLPFGVVGTIEPTKNVIEQPSSTATQEEKDEWNFYNNFNINNITEYGRSVKYGNYTQVNIVDKILSYYSLDNLFGVRIPEHAQSIICEIHSQHSVTSKATPLVTCVVTATDWDKCKISFSNLTLGIIDTFGIPTDNKGNITISSIPTLNENFDSSVKILYNNITESSFYSNNTHQTYKQIGLVEIPLYRDKNGMKFFNFGVAMNEETGYWVLRAIGYRA